MEKIGIGKILLERRTELSLTQRQAAIFVGVTEATVSRRESGDIDNVRRDKITRPAEELDLLEKWRILELSDKEIIRELIKRLRLLARSARNSTANSVVTQKNYSGNNYFGINGGNFNSNVSAQ